LASGREGRRGLLGLRSRRRVRLRRSLRLGRRLRRGRVGLRRRRARPGRALRLVLLLLGDLLLDRPEGVLVLLRRLLDLLVHVLRDGLGLLGDGVDLALGLLRGRDAVLARLLVGLGPARLLLELVLLLDEAVERALHGAL